MRYLSRYSLVIASFRLATAGIPAHPSPVADTDLICPTEDAVDCYPRLFQPTEKFQRIREGQELPLGLHVRMNVWTGEKEARLNIPIDSDVEQQLKGLPTEHSIVVVDQSSETDAKEEPSLRDQVPQKPPAYEAAGKIMPPQDLDGSGGDAENFYQAIRVLTENYPDGDLESALSVLSDLAHDIYYGVELTKSSAFQQLLKLMSCEIAQYRRQAASILGSSIQNNPTALKEAQKARPLLSQENLISTLQSSLEDETDASATRAKISFLYGLTKSPEMRDFFVKNKGMDLLLSIFKKKGDEWDVVRVKISQFIMDTFLDPEMGAEIGIWPTRIVEDWHEGDDEERCVMADGGVEPCWEWYLQALAWKGADGVDWLEHFLGLLGIRGPPHTGRGMVEDEGGHNEL